VLKPDLSILPPAQQAFWSKDAPAIPRGFVLYGGTAVALRCGHRQSVDFDWFASRAGLLPRVRKFLERFPRHRIVQRDNRSLTALIGRGAAAVKLQFFEGLTIGRVGTPDVCENGVVVASVLDLLGTKLTTIQERIEAKDYLDIDALLRSGVGLDKGIAAAQALYPQLSPTWTAKSVGWFQDGNLETELPKSVKERLAVASGAWAPSPKRARLRAKTLHPDDRKQ
jgi:hypothetical protein